MHSHHPLVVWTRSELVALVEKPANQKRRITAGRERAVTETAVCPVPLAGVLADGSECPACEGRKVHTCENCKGRGRFIPMMLDSRISRDPESELEEVGLQ